jgi:hypothetical protein
MSATVRRLEFEIEWLDLDPSKETVKIVALTPRAVAWLDHRGAQALVERVNAMGRSAHELCDAIQDLLEEDAGLLPTDPGPPIPCERGTSSEFAVEYEDAPDDDGAKIATIIGLSPRAQGWLDYQGDEIAWRISKVQVRGELIESVCQRLLEADLGPTAKDESGSESFSNASSVT